MMTTDLLVDTFIFKSENDLSAPDFVQDETTVRVDLGADDIGFGVAAQDNRTDIGYLIYTEEPVSERFSNMVAGASDRFFAVSYNASNHTWYYHANDKLYAFVPSATDRLVAVLDFGSDTAHILTVSLPIFTGPCLCLGNGGPLMANKRARPENIITKLRQVEVLMGQGMSRLDAIRQIGVVEQTYYRWRKRYGGMGIDQLKELKRLQKENEQLRRAVSDLTLDKLILKEAAKGNF